MTIHELINAIRQNESRKQSTRNESKTKIVDTNVKGNPEVQNVIDELSQNIDE